MPKPDDFDARVSLPKDHTFRYPAHEPAPHELGIPADYAEPATLRTASEIERERLSQKGLRMYPDSSLRKPVRRYADTFSAVTLLKRMFRLGR